MKNWQDKLKWTGIGLAITAAYMLAILIPVLVLCVRHRIKGPILLFLKDGIEALGTTFVFPVLLISLITAQVVMLSLSLSLSRGKFHSRRQLWVPLSTAGLLLAELHFWAVAAVFCGI